MNRLEIRKLAKGTLDAQQRTATDVADLRAGPPSLRRRPAPDVLYGTR